MAEAEVEWGGDRGREREEAEERYGWVWLAPLPSGDGDRTSHWMAFKLNEERQHTESEATPQHVKKERRKKEKGII